MPAVLPRYTVDMLDALAYSLPSGERQIMLDLHDLFRDVPVDEDR